MGTRESYKKVVIEACTICGDETAFANAIGVPVASVVDNRAFLEQVRSRHPVRRPRQ
jgi:hypothetical protein